MEENFGLIFSEIRENVSKMLEGQEVVPSNGSGSIPFNIPIDGNGNGSYETSQHGWGVTIHAEAIINDPDGIFNLEVNSSDGGGGRWHDIHKGQKVSCEIKTSFWHNTKITVRVHSSVPNCKLNGVIYYKY